MAVSCLFFLFPAACLTHTGNHAMAFVAAETAVWSIIADYYVQPPTNSTMFTKYKGVLEGIDRVNAAGYGAAMLWVGITKVGVLVMAPAIAGMLSTYIYSRASKTVEEWVIRHSMWHVAAAGIPGVLILMGHTG